MTILVAVLIWVVAMLIAVPQLLYFTTEYNPGKFPENAKPESSLVKPEESRVGLVRQIKEPFLKRSMGPILWNFYVLILLGFSRVNKKNYYIKSLFSHF